MKIPYYSETAFKVSGECTSCKRVLAFAKDKIQEHDKGFSFDAPLSCKCGSIYSGISFNGKTRTSAAAISAVSTGNKQDVGPKCPKCGSEHVSANKKGFGLGKAVGAGLLLGPVGILGGFFGSGKVKITCLKCGSSWSP